MSRIKTLVKRAWDKKEMFSMSALTKMRGYFWYNNHSEHVQLDDRKILFECRQGADLQGNIFYLLKEAVTDTDKQVYLACIRKSWYKVQSLLATYNLLHDVNMVVYGSRKYYKLLAKAKFLITDVSFPTNFVRKEGQIYLNTWHGTPLKAMGRQSKDARMTMGNVQRNFMQATHLLWPNDYTRDIMERGYYIKDLCPNTQTLVGMYPRDEIYTKERPMFSNRCGKKVYGYLPTWREHPTKPMDEVLTELDKACPSDVIVFAKLHPLDTGTLNWSHYDHIRPMPLNLELNDALSRCDGLITDYSSVLFDYAYTNRPIVLFQYDRYEYLENRGLNRNLPLPVVDTATEVFPLLDEPVTYTEDMEIYCPKHVGETLLHQILVSESCVINHTEPMTAMYLGNLNKNGITTAGIAMANELAKTRKVMVTVPMNKAKDNNYALDRLTENVIFYPLSESVLGTGGLFSVIRDMFYMMRGEGYSGVKRQHKKQAERFQKTFYPNIEIDNMIQYTGYEFRKILDYGNLPADKHIIFVHNDMEQEVSVKGTLQRETLEDAYSNYDKIVIVSEAIRKPTEAFAKDNSHKIEAIGNWIEIERLQREGNEPIQFSQDTVCELPEQWYVDVLKTHEWNFITVGRYSKEKQHDLLIKAFELMGAENASLTIIGGYGEEYESIKELAQQTGTDIVCIKSLENVQSILKQCDCFVLTSKYEAQPLVLYEAYIQGCDLIVTDIEMNKVVVDEIGCGTIVSAEPEAIAKAMKESAGRKDNSNLDPLTKHNAIVSEQWGKLLDGETKL